MLAAGNAFASKHKPRQVSPVSQPALAAGLQPGLHPAAAAPAHPPLALSSQNQTPTPSCIACGKGSWPSAALRRALCLFPRGELPPAALFPLCPEPGWWHQLCHAPQLWQPSFLGDRNAELGFRWRAAGWGGGSPAPVL